MSSEVPNKEGKLLVAKSWFARSASKVTLQNASTEAAPNEVTSGVSVSKEGAVERGVGFASFRQQLSMRSMGSREFIKEAGPESPSMIIKDVTPLTPLTPLKWKSNLRDQEEADKSLERSRLGSNTSAVRTYEEYPEAKPAGEVKEERSAEGQQHGSPVAEHDRTNPADELSTEVRQGNIGEEVGLESFEGSDRKASSGDDVMAMTIEFLRARLLSERSASKTAKLQIQELSKKVSELEEKLDEALKEQKQAEVRAQEAFMKLRLAESSNQGTNSIVVESSDGLISISSKGSPLSMSRSGREDVKCSQQEAIINKDVPQTKSCGSSIEDRDSSAKGSFSETVSKIEEHTADQGRACVRPSPNYKSETSQETHQEQESRAVIESRLRNMWSKISEDMTAFAEGRREDVQEELVIWMGQVPAVLQNTVRKKILSPTQDEDLRSESETIKLQGMPRQTVDSQPGPVHIKDQPYAEEKRAALLHDQFTFQENVQREWERNYQEVQKLDKLEGDALHGNSLPNGSSGHPELQHADDWNGPEYHSSFLGPHLTTLAKSRITVDLPTRVNEYNLDMNSPQWNEAYSDPWDRERPRRLGAEGRYHDSTYQNSPAHGRMAVDRTHSKHSRIYQDISGAPSILAEDGYPSSKSDFRAGEFNWDDRDLRHSQRHQQVLQWQGDADGRIEKDCSYHRVSEIEEPYSFSNSESTHWRSHCDNYDCPAVEDYSLLCKPPELTPGLGRRQSYSGYSVAMAAEPRHTNLDKPSGSYNDLHYVDERMYRADEQRRSCFPVTKVDDAYGKPNSTPLLRNGDLIAEPTLSLGFGPAYDAPPREDSPMQQSPKGGLNKNVSDVLRALQLAKAKIQNGGDGSMGHRTN